MIWQGDVFFRRIIELTLQDLRENPWLVDDILSDFVTDPMLSNIYGQKEIENAKKWLNDNEVSVFLPHRMDLEKMPCVTISIGSNTEDKRLARLADLTPYVDTYKPSDVGKTIPYVIQPFDYVSYDQPNGYIVVPPSVDLSIVQPGMVVVDPQEGIGFAIINKDNNGIYIAKGTILNKPQLGVIPQYIIFKARREIATFQERITLGCHVHGDPNALLWLYSFMMYGVLRYREGALESRNFQLSNIETSDMVRNENFTNIGENVYSRFISITGQVENTWIKAPKRVIESMTLADNDGNAYDDGAQNDGNVYDDGAQNECPVGICIIGPDGNKIPEIIDTEEEIWAAKDKGE